MMSYTNKLSARPVAKRQFTLMELMIVLLIMGLLAALVTPAFIGKAEKAKAKTAQMQIKLLSNAVYDYYLDVDEYPNKLSDLVEKTGGEKWAGPYLDPPMLPTDPWGEPYHYRQPGEHGRFDIFSYGADKAPGGDGNNADITNWQ